MKGSCKKKVTYEKVGCFIRLTIDGDTFDFPQGSLSVRPSESFVDIINVYTGRWIATICADEVGDFNDLINFLNQDSCCPCTSDTNEEPVEKRLDNGYVHDFTGPGKIDAAMLLAQSGSGNSTIDNIDVHWKSGVITYQRGGASVQMEGPGDSVCIGQNVDCALDDGWCIVLGDDACVRIAWDEIP